MCDCKCCKSHRTINARLLKRVDLAWDAARTWRDDHFRAAQLQEENDKLRVINKRLRREVAEQET